MASSLRYSSLCIHLQSLSDVPRIHPQSLSDIPRIHPQPLSDEKHYEGDDEEEGDHNPDFDHEAFLGKEEAQSFDSLSPEESQRRLG